MSIKVKENIDYQDFMKINFPDVLKPFYTKRMFIINILFAVVYMGIAIYVFSTSFKNGVKFEFQHYTFIFFGLLFTWLAFYVMRREKRIYHKLVNNINDLATEYTFDNNDIRVHNDISNLHYKRSDIKEIKELSKWYIFYFKNDDKLSIYKPNFGDKVQDFKQMYQSLIVD